MCDNVDIVLLACLGQVDHIARPVCLTPRPIAGLRVIGRLDALGGLRQLGVRSPPHRTGGPLVVPRPGGAQDLHGGPRPQLSGRLIGIQGIEQDEAVLAHDARVRLAHGPLLGQPGALDTAAIPLEPLGPGHGPGPLRSDRRQLIQRRP